MHYRIRYMHVKYQLTRDKRFVKTVNTKNKLNCMNLQLPIAIFKNRPFQTCIIVKRTCISIFSKIGLVDQSKLCTQIYLQKFAYCINLQLAIRILKNHAFRTCTTPSRTFRPILRSNGLLDNELPPKEIISTDDRRTDGTTDGQTSRTTIGSFFEKRKKLLKMNLLFNLCLTHSNENMPYCCMLIMLLIARM